MFIVCVKSMTLLIKELSYSIWVKYMKLIIRKTIIRTIETFFTLSILSLTVVVADSKAAADPLVFPTRPDIFFQKYFSHF